MSPRSWPETIVRWICCRLPAIGLMLAPMVSWAVLGDNLDSIANDQSRMQGSRVATRVAHGGSVHEIRLADGSSIRQFVNAQGIVYAVAWSTRLKPDLTQLLGRYAADFEAGTAAKALTRGVRRRASVDRGDLVVHSAGRLNAFVGKAWLKSQLPPGVDPDDIR
jgi:hypothetical protein